MNKQLSAGLFDFLSIGECFEQGKYLECLEGQISEKIVKKKLSLSA